MTSRSVWHRPLARFLHQHVAGRERRHRHVLDRERRTDRGEDRGAKFPWRRHGPISRVGSQTTSAGT